MTDKQVSEESAQQAEAAELPVNGQLVYFVEKIANLTVHGIADGDIANACGLSEAQISAIRMTPEYVKQHSDAASEALDTQITRNDAWDNLEMRALSNLMGMLEYNQDPDLNVKVAAIANKAQRRGHKNNDPIDGRSGEKAVINLTQNFVTKLQDHHTIIDSEKQQTVYEKKSQDFLAPGQVERIFHGQPMEVDDSPMGQLTQTAENLARMMKNA